MNIKEYSLESLDKSKQEKLETLLAQEKYEDVEDLVFSIIQQRSDWTVGWRMLSDLYLLQGKDARIPALRTLELNGQDPKEYCHYGLVLKKSGDLLGAATAFEKAIKLKDDYAIAHNNLGLVMKDLGAVDYAVDAFKKALELNPNYSSCLSNLLFTLTHQEDIDSEALLKSHLAFSNQFEAPIKPHWKPHHNVRDENKLIQVGFVCADFRDASVNCFLEPILQFLSINPDLSLHAYSNAIQEDSNSEKLRSRFRFWNNVSDLSDARLCEKIRNDEIDILVDLSGHTINNRLMTFAMKPAPVQVSWLGYLNTTGLESIDYYLADHHLLPPNIFDNQFTEKLVQLPANAPFMPSDVAPEVNELPALTKGYITFASFNRPNKISQATITLWAKLMHAVPGSKILLGGMPNDGSYDALINWFNESGIGRERLEFHPRSFMKNYLKLHHEVDICLDTFPSNGVTTTCHAAWMGVPTLSLEGGTLTSRAAMAIMKHVGLNSFVADNHEDFVRKGARWASNLTTLSDIRTSLRSRFNQSALAQPEMLADAFSHALRKMWKTWCNETLPSSFVVSQSSAEQFKKNEIIYVTQPTLPKLKDYIPYLEQIWENKYITNGGPFHQQLEKALCEYLGVKHIALFANGTLALLTALQSLRITGEVITTPYSFVATSHSLLWNGIKPVFVDIDPNTLNLDPKKIEAAITPETTAIMPVHCYGYPCDVDAIQKIADDYNLKVIYDAAHAFGVQHKGQSLLNYGDLSVLSFHATKVFNTFEGGAIICPDAKTKQRIDHLKNFGFVDEVTVVAAGVNGKMSEINASFGLLQLKGIDHALYKRKCVDQYYRKHFEHVDGIKCLDNSWLEIANYAYFPIMVEANYPLTRDELYNKLRDEGIYARRYFYPLISDFPMYRALPSATKENLPNAQIAALAVICLPIYPDLNIAQMDAIIAIVSGHDTSN